MITNQTIQRLSGIVVRSLLAVALLIGGFVVQPVQASTMPTAPAPIPATLNADEIAGLLFMREEEKLAHDVYGALAATWDLPIFANIARSEQQHTDAVRFVIGQYGLTDPAAGNAPGIFVDPTLQALYNDLVAQGSQSLVAALQVGAIIEETDITDLQTRIAQTNHGDIAQLYANLLHGSSNHLRAYVSTWARATGEEYVPQYLDQESYDAIISGTVNNGRGGQGRGGHSPRGR